MIFFIICYLCLPLLESPLSPLALLLDCQTIMPLFHLSKASLVLLCIVLAWFKQVQISFSLSKLLGVVYNCLSSSWSLLPLGIVAIENPKHGFIRLKYASQYRHSHMTVQTNHITSLNLLTCGIRVRIHPLLTHRLDNVNLQISCSKHVVIFVLTQII